MVGRKQILMLDLFCTAGNMDMKGDLSQEQRLGVAYIVIPMRLVKV